MYTKEQLDKYKRQGNKISDDLYPAPEPSLFDKIGDKIGSYRGILREPAEEFFKNTKDSLKTG